MSELVFEVDLVWQGSGRTGAGVIVTDELDVEYSVPESMGGRGVGTNPEELLVSAVASCYSATLQGLLHRAGLPAAAVHVAASGTVTGWPTASRFERLTVSPAIVDGDLARQHEYVRLAQVARERCFIGRTIAGNVEYDLGAVTVEPGRVAA